MPIDGLQHATQAAALLRCEAVVRCDGAAMESSPEACDGSNAIKAVGAKRDQRGDRLIC